LSLLEGKSVIITGAGSGVGRASALLFARQGAHLVCADLRPEWVRETVHQIEDQAGRAIAVECDVSHGDQIKRVVETAVGTFGRLDIMFNNAGIASPRRGILFEEHTGEDFDRLVSVNGRSVFHGCREAMIQFKSQGDGGVILNTASIAGLVAIGSAVYGGTKAMVIQLTRALAIEAAPHGIRVNCICPSGMSTNFGRSENEAFKLPPPEDIAQGKAMHPLGKSITPDDCASAALYLVSDLSANVTGVALPIDGGYIAR
jgi:NAD(P)-dependent dehydrogenase (short-subunit alcohol dehydrogenase family)